MFDNCCVCAENLKNYKAYWQFEIQWAPKLHPQSTKWRQKAQQKHNISTSCTILETIAAPKPTRSTPRSILADLALISNSF